MNSTDETRGETPRLTDPLPAPGGSAPLLPSVAAGEPGALSALLERSGALIHGIVRRYVGDPADIDDAVQDVSVSIWRSASRFDPRQGRESTFLATITRRRMIDRLRHLSRRPEPVDLEGVDEPDAHDALEAVDVRDEARRVQRAIGELSEVRRRVLRLALTHGWTHVRVR